MNCDKCDRPVFCVERWHRSYKPALLNEDWEEDDQMTWLETSPGVFEPANHHQCPGKLDEAEWRRQRDEQRRKLGLDMKGRRRPIKGQWELL